MLWLLSLVLVGCGSPEGPPQLTEAQVTAKVRPGTEQPERWARAVIAGLERAEQPVTPQTACQVLAVIEQESGYQANPPVPGIDRMVEQELRDQLSFLGPLDDAAFEALLNVRAGQDQPTYGERLRAAETERDLDLLYREILDHAASTVPVVGSATQKLAAGWLERHNPVSTVGSMQVKVDFARDQRNGDDVPRRELRDHLYTIDGGVRFGTLRLFQTADYADPLHRFADYNAGPYASRNAAFQRQLQTISGQTVQSDGDLLVYNDRGRPRGQQNGQTVTVLTRWAGDSGLDLPPDRIVRDLRNEKSAAFEETATWKAVRDGFEAKLGREPAYAIVPVVTLDSPKLNGNWTTESFAKRVNRRYRACLER